MGTDQPPAFWGTQGLGMKLTPNILGTPPPNPTPPPSPPPCHRVPRSWAGAVRVPSWGRSQVLRAGGGGGGPAQPAPGILPGLSPALLQPPRGHPGGTLGTPQGDPIDTTRDTLHKPQGNPGDTLGTPQEHPADTPRDTPGTSWGHQEHPGDTPGRPQGHPRDTLGTPPAHPLSLQVQGSPPSPAGPPTPLPPPPAPGRALISLWADLGLHPGGRRIPALICQGIGSLCSGHKGGPTPPAVG